MTTKSTITVNGGAMPKFNRKAIMARAWAIFRETYKYPAIKFSGIGWKCFGWALRTAWAEAREAARIADISADGWQDDGRAACLWFSPRPTEPTGDLNPDF